MSKIHRAERGWRAEGERPTKSRVFFKKKKKGGFRINIFILPNADPDPKIT